MVKFLFWAVLIGGGIFVGGQVWGVHYNNYKIENIFEGSAQNLVTQSESDVRKRVIALLKIQSVDMKMLPPEFMDNLAVIRTREGKLQISSEYHIVLWLLGKPQSVDPEEDYNESDVSGMDKVRLKARMDFDFAPFKESP